MFENIFLVDLISLVLLFWLLCESCFGIILYITFNLLYRERQYLKKSSILVLISLMYNFFLFWIVLEFWSLLDTNYSQSIDLIVSISLPFFMLTSLYALYLAIKNKKIIYIISYIYIIFYLESLVLEPIIIILFQAPSPIYNDFWLMIMSVIFLVIVAVIELKVFYTIRGTTTKKI